MFSFLKGILPETSTGLLSWAFKHHLWGLQKNGNPDEQWQQNPGWLGFI